MAGAVFTGVFEEECGSDVVGVVGGKGSDECGEIFVEHAEGVERRLGIAEAVSRFMSSQ